MSHARSLGPASGVAAALPVTGVDTMLLVLIGAALLIAGVLLVRAGHRRRVQG